MNETSAEGVSMVHLHFRNYRHSARCNSRHVMQKAVLVFLLHTNKTARSIYSAAGNFHGDDYALLAFFASGRHFISTTCYSSSTSVQKCRAEHSRV
jgi:hypothetical protein